MDKAVEMTLEEQYALLDTLNKRNLAKTAALEAECREYREALEAAAYNLERIETADWCIEQARLAAGAGGRIARKALSAGRNG